MLATCFNIENYPRGKRSSQSWNALRELKQNSKGMIKLGEKRHSHIQYINIEKEIENAIKDINQSQKKQITTKKNTE